MCENKLEFINEFCLQKFGTLPRDIIPVQTKIFNSDLCNGKTFFWYGDLNILSVGGVNLFYVLRQIKLGDNLVIGAGGLYYDSIGKQTNVVATSTKVAQAQTTLYNAVASLQFHRYKDIIFNSLAPGDNALFFHFIGYLVIVY